MKKLFLFGLGLSLLLIGCKDDNSPSGPTTSNLELNITGLEDLGSSAMYEGWIMVDGAPKTTGTFTVDASGNLSKSSFEIDSDELSSATAFILTIEPNPDPSPNPSDVHLIAGDFNGSSASLSVGHGAALGDNFSSISGKYILATPTNGADTDEKSGIWFLDLSSGSPAVGLDLPTLPAGWKYEGWTVINGVPVTSGTFTSVTEVDDADPFSSTQPGPPFPGEDYLVNAPNGLTFPTDLSGGTAVISIEPDPDNSPNPFTLKPLVKMIPTEAADHVTYNMDKNLGSFPTGTASK
ncbi:MAG: hypothetical protein OQJ81_07580 [Melioribacteraceae bacterium]|nr:hypothetical protein [Melioribacteraceae bacterium]